MVTRTDFDVFGIDGYQDAKQVAKDGGSGW
jgi:hypothetical protein